MQIETRIHARAGLLGNPSDGYFGKTIACLVENFCASVRLEESDQLVLTTPQRAALREFPSPSALLSAYQTERCPDELRLLQASCKRFFAHCQQHDLTLAAPNFTASFRTTIPRQVGLAGSSAIVIATLRSLIQWYGVEEYFPTGTFPTLALEVETQELGIAAGLQDRVIQTYGGVTYMDFDQTLMEAQGYGRYERLERTLLPPFFLAYTLAPSDSGKIHSDVRRRWLEGDKEVRQAMRTFAGLAESGKTALRSQNFDALAILIREAFSLRRKIFGDAVLGEENLRMVELANHYGLPATTCGSGGAIFGIAGDEEQNALLAKDLDAEGFCFLPLTVGPEYQTI